MSVHFYGYITDIEITLFAWLFIPECVCPFLSTGNNLAFVKQSKFLHFKNVFIVNTNL